MKNRGPNNFSFSHYKKNKINVYLLHSRLSIIDLNILIESLSKSKSNKNYSFQKEELTQNTKNEELKSNRIRYFFLLVQNLKWI